MLCSDSWNCYEGCVRVNKLFKVVDNRNDGVSLLFVFHSQW